MALRKKETSCDFNIKNISKMLLKENFETSENGCWNFNSKMSEANKEPYRFSYENNYYITFDINK